MKTRSLTQISLQNDPINRRMHVFRSEFLKTKIEVQDVISSFSLDQSLISSIQWMRKYIKNTRKQTAHEMMVYTNQIWRKSTGDSFRREEQFLKKDFKAQSSDLMDSSRSTVAMRRRFTNWRLFFMTVGSQTKGWDESSSREEEDAELRSSIGFKSNDRDHSESPPIGSNLSRYNSWN